MRVVSYRVRLILAPLLLAIALAACQPPTALLPEPAANPTEPAAATPEQEAVAEPLELVNTAGRSIILTELPQRIMVVGHGPHMSLHILYMFDEGRQRLVGAESRGATPSDFLSIVDPAFGEIPTLAANPNVEQIAAMAPDLVIMKGITEDATASGLAVLGIPVLYLDLETMDTFFEELANIGAVLGNQARADEIAAFYRSRLEAIDGALAEVEDADKPSVLLVSYSERGGEIAVQVPAAAWMQTAQIQRAGGDPVWLSAAAPTDGWTITNIEQIAQWNADKIFVVVHHSLNPQDTIDQLKADANWSALKAVQNGQLYAFPQDIFGWDQPEPRWILGVQWLATRLHPGLFADVDMEAEVRTWFGELYGMEAAAIEQDIMPRVVMDVQ
jgi:iron complex transport system substrate-binding protein